MASGGYIDHDSTGNLRVERVRFLNIRKAYIAGEKVSLLYQISADYDVTRNDCIILCKYPWLRVNVFTPHRWSASTKRINGTYHVYITIPLEKDKGKEYQLLYVNEEGKVEGRSGVIRVDGDEASNADEAEVKCAYSKAIGSLFDSKFWRSNEWLAGISNSTGINKKEANPNGQQLVVRPPNSVIHYSPRMLDLYQTLSSINRFMVQYQELHRKSEQECDKLLEEVTSSEQILIQNQRLEEKVSEYRNLSSDELERKRDEFVQEQTILDEQRREMERGMMENGYSTIVDLDDEEHEISSEAGKTLHLGRWCIPKNREHELEKTHRDNKTQLKKLNGECERLTNQMMQLKQQHKQCINEMFSELEALREIQRGEREKEEKTISNLESRIENLMPNRDEEENKCLLDYLQTLRQELEDKDALIEMLQYDSDHPNEIDLMLAAHVKHLEAELREKEVELMNCVKHSNRESHPPTDSIQSTTEKVRSARAQSKRSKRRAKKMNTDTIKTTETGQQCIKNSTEHRATSTVEPKCTSKRNATNVLFAPTRPHQLVYKSRSDAAACKEKENADLLNQDHTMRASEQGFSCCASSNQENWLKLLKRLLSKSTQPQIQLGDLPTPTCKLSPSDLFFNNLFSSDASIPTAPCNSASSLNDCCCPTSDHSTGSFEMATALRRMFAISDDDLHSILPKASNESIASLGEALRNLFRTASKKQVDGLSLSNDSLAESLALLFREAVTGDNSTTSLSSTESMILWGLLDPEPEEQVGVDVKAINIEKAERSRTHQRKKSPCGRSIDPVNLAITGVIRSSSPDSDVNIEHPRQNSPKRSLIPRPIRTSNLRQRTKPQQQLKHLNQQLDSDDSSEDESSQESPSLTYNQTILSSRVEIQQSSKDTGLLPSHRQCQNRLIWSKNARKYRRHSRSRFIYWLICHYRSYQYW